LFSWSPGATKDRFGLKLGAIAGDGAKSGKVRDLSHAPVAQRAQPFGGRANWSIFVAMMKSFSCNPLIFLVRKDTVA
jgi:hypothetical protein